MSPKPDWNRPPGILTKKDRQYLRGEEISENRQVRYERRKGIRNRVRNGLLDFQDIWEIDQDERRKIVDGFEPRADLYTSLVYLIAFADYCARDAGYDLEEIISGGIQYSTYEPDERQRDIGEYDSGEIQVLEDVTVNIRRHFKSMPAPNQLYDQLMDGEHLSYRELSMLISSGVLDEEGWNQLQSHYGARSDSNE